jgi:hypothetical protein
MSVFLNIAALTPALVGAGLAFDVPRLIRAQDADPAAPALFGAEWKPGDTSPTPLLRYTADNPGVTAVFLYGDTVNLSLGEISDGFDFEIADTEVGNIAIDATTSGTMEFDALPQMSVTVVNSDPDISTYEDLPKTMGFPGRLTINVQNTVTPDAIGDGLDIEIGQVFSGYETEAARTSGAPRLFFAVWDPIARPAPATVNIRNAEIIGTIEFLAVSTEPMEFRLNAAGSIEGTADATLTIKASVQPLPAKEAQEVADLTQGRRAYRIYTDTRLYKASDNTVADRIQILGEDFEVMDVEEWNNGLIPHYKCLAVSLVPIAGGDR